MNPDLARLQPYPFERLSSLLADVSPADLPPVSLSVGEPRHQPPQFALDALVADLQSVTRYPSTRGDTALRRSIAGWLARRYGLGDVEALAEHHILPVNGTREGLFAIAQCLLDRTAASRDVLMPNPFYQIYEGATLLAGCRPAFYAISDAADDDLDAIDDASWDRCQLIYVCSPGNPTGAVLSRAALERLIERAHRHDFVIVSDECYSEIYREASGPPCGLLEASASAGNGGHARCLSFHSLSKRSNLAGLRSGFVAGDRGLLTQFLRYRTYHGCSMSGPVQAASIAAWDDEVHVSTNRLAYDAKYTSVVDALAAKLPVTVPPGGFYLWPTLPLDDAEFTVRLLAEQNVRVVPGSYLARSTTDDPKDNPGHQRIRLALVAEHDACTEAARRIAACLPG